MQIEIATILMCVIILASIVIPKIMVETASCWSACIVVHAQVPLTKANRVVPCCAEFVSKRDVIQWQTIILLAYNNTMLKAQTNRVSPRHECTTCWRANGLCVIMFQFDALLSGQQLHIGPCSSNVCGRIKIVETHVINQNVNQMRCLGHDRGCQTTRQQCFGHGWEL